MSGHHRSLPLYCVIGADALSRAGNAMTTIAIPLIVLNQGYSAAEVGLSSAAASLPIVIGALAGGSFADRIGYRTTSVISDAASGVTVLVLGLLAQLHMLPLWALLALVFLSNLMDAPGSGARVSQIPDLTRLAGVPLTRSTGIRSPPRQIGHHAGIGRCRCRGIADVPRRGVVHQRGLLPDLQRRDHTHGPIGCGTAAGRRSRHHRPGLRWHVLTRFLCRSSLHRAHSPGPGHCHYGGAHQSVGLGRHECAVGAVWPRRFRSP